MKTAPCETCGASVMAGSPTCWHCVECGTHHPLGAREFPVCIDPENPKAGPYVLACSEECARAAARRIRTDRLEALGCFTPERHGQHVYVRVPADVSTAVIYDWAAEQGLKVMDVRLRGLVWLAKCMGPGIG